MTVIGGPTASDVGPSEVWSENTDVHPLVRKHRCASITRPHFAIWVVFRTTYGVVVLVAMCLCLERHIAHFAFKGSRVAVCLLMHIQTTGLCTFEVTPFPGSFIDMVTHVVEDLVVMEVHVFVVTSLRLE